MTKKNFMDMTREDWVALSVSIAIIMGIFLWDMLVLEPRT